MPRYLSTPRNHLTVLASCIIVLIFCFSTLYWSLSSPAPFSSLTGTSKLKTERRNRYATASTLAQEMRVDPIRISDFRKLGERLHAVKEWISYTQYSDLTSSEEENWSRLINKVTSELVPFIQHPKSSNGKHLDRLRGTFVPGSKGLVIPTGRRRFRYACHLVANIRDVLGSDLPIQIAYAGDDDLPTVYRDFIVSLAPHVTVFDVTSIFDEDIAGIEYGGWAIKPFAVLGSTFEQIILLDSDDVFLQSPETIFNEHPQFLERGNLLFHDRLLWQGAYPERHAWWEKELSGHNLSDTIRQSKVYVDGFAEEADSGVVAVDKSRPEVLLALLHIAWQNSKDVRDSFTYVYGHGDKESWWFGFELTRTPYSMEQHYAAIVGHATAKNMVCSFTIAHVDHKSKLFWYNGSLLKNKEINSADFDVPRKWMIDGKWEKGHTKQDLSCMSGAQVQSLDDEIVVVVAKTVQQAMIIDQHLNQTLPECITW